MDRFTMRAENIVNAVLQVGRAAVPQVSSIIADTHRCAMEEVAQEFDRRSGAAMRSDPPRPDLGAFFTQTARDIRALKNKRGNE